MANINFENNLSTREIVKSIQPTLQQEILHYIRYFIQIFLIVTLVYTSLRAFVFDIGAVDGNSMLPNFINTETFYIDQLTPAFSEYSRGDVITLYTKEDGKSTFYIKRIIALPGEQIAFEKGDVFIKQSPENNWVKLDESAYIPGNFDTRYQNSDKRFEHPTLKTDEYFVLGDNREISRDSRSIGPIKRINLVGKVRLVISPDTKNIELPEYNIPN